EKSDVMTPEVFDQIFSVVDEVEYMLNSIADKGSAESKNFHQIIENLRENIIKYGGEPEAEKEVGESVESAPFQEEVQYQASELTKNEFLQKKKTDAHVRMHVKQIDSLLNEAAELVIYHNQFKTQINRYKGYVPKLDLESKNLQSILWHLEKLISRQQHLLEQLDRGDKGTVTTLEESQKINYQNLKEVSESLHRVHENFIQSLQGIKNSGKLYEEQLQKITRLSNSIHDEIIKARLVPIGLLFQRFQRPLRDLARKNKKKIRLIIEGENTELDRILADELYEPMLHIFRNALDHGIETPAERKKNGKPEEGLIRISAEQERNYVLISIEDDGRGINISDIREKIVERGLVNPEKAKDLTPAELYEFLMVPGFSTARKKGVLSGRGVGLDAVRNQIQKIKGDLRISSTPQQNTRFTIRVPFSITVTQAMLVEVNKNVYAIPLLQVEETVNISDDKLDLQDDGYYLTIRNSQVPVIPMGNLLDLRGESDRQITRVSQYPVIIVQDEGQKAALLVDKILHREEILIKSLGGMLQGVKYIMGGSILADGQVVLVLDIPQIVFNTLRTKEKSLNLQPRDFKKNEKKQTDTSLKRTLPKRIIEGRKPKILIVDDSLSIRKFLSSLLSKHNYEVEAAPNGQSAIELLSQTEFDAVITDLEMPQLSGYDLIEHIRSDSRWDDLPVLVLTGRAGKNIEQQTLKLGANDFIIKPFKEKELLDKLKNFIERNE
ncbi:MAG: hybrid sensor histidine kinase/response regulator, partial [Calditrichaeota bacterium]